MSLETNENPRLSPPASPNEDQFALPDESSAPSDRQLLTAFLANGSEQAFAELVTRHSGFVYSSALRQTRNQIAAEEITQAVFIILARKMSAIRWETGLRGWLFRAVRYAAMDFHKMEKRRIRREQEAVRLESTRAAEEPSPAWDQLAPDIDAALASLSAKDRDAVLLRFFEKKGFREIGEKFGGNENAARLRVVRALEKLRAYFHNRGIALSEGQLSRALLIPEIQPPPKELHRLAMLMAASANGPAGTMAFVRAIQRRFLRQRLAPWLTITATAFFLIVVAVTSFLEPQVPVVPPARASVLAIDRAISYAETDAFLAHVRFRGPDDEQYKPTLTEFIRATVALRMIVRDKFNARPVQIQIWLWEVRQLFQGQPRRDDIHLLPDQLTDEYFQIYPMVMTKEAGVWKWDLFGQLSPATIKDQMKTLQTKTALCNNITHQIEQGTITTADQALTLLREDSH